MLGTVDQILDRYTYGKDLSAQFIDRLRFELHDHQLIINNWDDYTNNTFSGDCDELAVKAYQKIKQEYPDADVKICWGYEPTFFTNKSGMHSFLQLRYNHEEFIIDPSFKRIVKANQSNYCIHHTSSESEIQEKIAKGSLELVLNEERGRTTLGIDIERKEIFYLGLIVDENRCEDHLLDLKVHHFNQDQILKTRYIKPTTIPHDHYKKFLAQMNNAIREKSSK